MAAASARAQKPVGSAPWIAAEKENMADLVDQEMEEVEYPVRHEMAWLNEHMTEIFSKGQTNFADVFKTPGKMRGKTPRTARKRVPEESRVPLSEIFSSAQKQVENHASPSPFIHRVVSKTAAAAPSSPVPRTKDATEQVSQPEYPDLTENMNSFPKYNTDSGYHGMSEADEVVLPDVQSESQASTQPATQPLEQDEPMGMDAQEIEVSVVQQANEESFHSAQEGVRSRGGTVEPAATEPTPPQERPMAPTASPSRETSAELSATPIKKTKSKTKAKTIGKQQNKKPEPTEPIESPQLVSNPEPSTEKTPVAPVAPPIENSETQPDDEVMEEATEDHTKDDTVLDNLDDIGSPSDGSTPERLPVRKSSLSFASLPAREPLKSLGGSRLSRTSHIDLSKMNNTRTSHFGRQTGSHRVTHVAPEENNSSGAMDVGNEKEPSEEVESEQATRMHSKKSTQTLHERISMLGKLQPVSRPRKSIPSTGVPAGQVSYPELPASKNEPNAETSSHKTTEIPVLEPTPADDDWIKPLSSPQRPDLSKSKTTDIMEKLSELEKERATERKDLPKAEPERPKSSASIFSSPRPQGHQQSASLSHISADISTTPTGSPRRFDGPISASKLRLHSIMKSAKGLFSSTGNTPKLDPSSPEQPRPHSSASVFGKRFEYDSQATLPPSPTRQEGRRTRSSTEKEEKRRQHEREEQEREEHEEEELRAEKAREQEKQKAIQLKAAQNKSSVEPEERSGPSVLKNPQSQRQQSREPESSRDTSSRFAIPQSKQNERRPLKPTRETLQKPTPQPMSIRVGSTLSRQIPMPSSSVAQDSSIPAVVSAPAPKPTLKKKGSNNSLHTASSASSFKSSISSQTQAAQRKTQAASKKEQEDRRKEEQRREIERKRAAQQEEARRQGMRSRAESRAEADRERRERSAQEDPKRAAQMEAIRRRQQENARGHVRQGSQQIANEGPVLQHEKPSAQSSQRSDLGASRPPSRLGGSIQPPARLNPPAPNPAKPPKRVLNDESGHRPAVSKPSNVQSTGDAKRRKTEDEHNPMQPVRTVMPGQSMSGQPMRQSYIRKPSISTFSHGQSSMAHQSGSSIFKNSAPQRPAHPGEMAKFATGKIPFAEPNPAPPPAAYKATPNSAQRPAAKPSPKYPSGENIHLPEINTDSEDDSDSDSEMFPVPKWAQPKELEGLLRQQDGMEVDSIFGPIAPFSLEDTFKADKKIKKYRDRTSSANWSGPDGLTQEEIRKDVADRQRLRLNGGWSFN
ncbi:unnamed protein product [Penicillium salamii]|nr:unnamed protein product [Penicillium salamii]CAG8409889.1 unnamed protein product [Penicillium salamii]